MRLSPLGNLSNGDLTGLNGKVTYRPVTSMILMVGGEGVIVLRNSPV